MSAVPPLTTLDEWSEAARLEVKPVRAEPLEVEPLGENPIINPMWFAADKHLSEMKGILERAINYELGSQQTRHKSEFGIHIHLDETIDRVQRLILEATNPKKAERTYINEYRFVEILSPKARKSLKKINKALYQIKKSNPDDTEVKRLLTKAIGNIETAREKEIEFRTIKGKLNLAGTDAQREAIKNRESDLQKYRNWLDKQHENPRPRNPQWFNGTVFIGCG
jgi:hypothetical protein